jgi:mono/diheme cytochrome c family protein
MNHLSRQLFRFAIPALSALLFLSVPVCAETDAASVFKTKCAACHGADGKGDTPIAKKLGVRDFASPEVQKETDEDLFNVTQKGRNKMPAFGSSLKDPQIKDLVAYIRELSKKK